MKTRFDIPEPISPIYEPSKLPDNNTTFLQGEVGQFNMENEQIINVCAIYNMFPRSNDCKCKKQICWITAN